MQARAQDAESRAAVAEAELQTLRKVRLPICCAYLASMPQNVMPVCQVANGIYTCSEVKAALDSGGLSQLHTKSMSYLAGPAGPV